MQQAEEDLLIEYMDERLFPEGHDAALGNAGGMSQVFDDDPLAMDQPLKDADNPLIKLHVRGTAELVKNYVQKQLGKDRRLLLRFTLKHLGLFFTEIRPTPVLEDFNPPLDPDPDDTLDVSEINPDY